MQRRCASARVIDLCLVLALFILAALIRWPFLWQIPRFTDELQEVLWSFAIARGDILPLTAVDSYYGPLWSYLLAGLFHLFGFSAELPRLTAMLLGAAMVVLTFGYARALIGRWGGLLAAALMATAGGHVVINSHTARSNSITPIVTTGALWLLWRATEGSAWLLVPTGFLLGLALQTHLSAIALGPGVVLFVLIKRPSLLRSPWPYLAVLAALVGYANMIVFNMENSFWSFRHAHSLQEGYTGGRSADLAFYTDNLKELLQSLSRLLSGTIDVPDSPARLLYTGLALLGLLLLARRGSSLPLLATLSIVLVLPYFNPRYGPILSGRYIVPIVPLAFTGLAASLLWVGGLLRHWADDTISSGSTRSPRHRLDVWLPIGASVLMVGFPLYALRAYYADVLADGRTNEPLFTTMRTILANRQLDEIVLVDEGLAQEQLTAGGTDLKAYRMLLEANRLPYELAKVGDDTDDQLAVREHQLILMETKKRERLPRNVRATPLGPEVASASGSGHRYAVYRLTLR
ncbi:MAG: glycosyltransferase family 39 protein [Chloroflexi bacterium]|nr:glycosyltransferase family 39 protein [Chloroflexota bacterium]